MMQNIYMCMCIVCMSSYYNLSFIIVLIIISRTRMTFVGVRCCCCLPSSSSNSACNFEQRGLELVIKSGQVFFHSNDRDDFSFFGCCWLILWSALIIAYVIHVTQPRFKNSFVLNSLSKLKVKGIGQLKLSKLKLSKLILIVIPFLRPTFSEITSFCHYILIISICHVLTINQVTAITSVCPHISPPISIGTLMPTISSPLLHSSSFSWTCFQMLIRLKWLSIDP